MELHTDFITYVYDFFTTGTTGKCLHQQPTATAMLPQCNKSITLVIKRYVCNKVDNPSTSLAFLEILPPWKQV